jgi:radical SAM superfamily enzyme with C-terminal helix-hairpin-helix motif
MPAMNIYTSCTHVLSGACSTCAEKLESERDSWRRTAILNGKRLEAIRSLTTTNHETMSQFVSRVRACLYQDHF